MEFVSQGQYSIGIAKKQVFFAQATVKQKSVWHEPYTEKRTAQAAKQTFTPTQTDVQRERAFLPKKTKTHTIRVDAIFSLLRKISIPQLSKKCKKNFIWMVRK